MIGGGAANEHGPRRGVRRGGRRGRVLPCSTSSRMPPVTRSCGTRRSPTWRPTRSPRVTAAVDANGRSQIQYIASQDFTLFGRTGARTALTDPGPLTVTVDVTTFDGGLSDDLEVLVRHGRGNAAITEHDRADRRPADRSARPAAPPRSTSPRRGPTRRGRHRGQRRRLRRDRLGRGRRAQRLAGRPDEVLRRHQHLRARRPPRRTCPNCRPAPTSTSPTRSRSSRTCACSPAPTTSHRTSR